MCIKSGNFADADPANHPEFKNYVDLTSGTVIGNITTPSITAPLGGEEFNSTSVSLASSAFSASGGITHASTNWQVATDVNFTNVVFESLANAVNLTSITASGLPNPSTLYVRVQYIGNGSEASAFSVPVNFATSAAPSVDNSVGEVSTFLNVTQSLTSNMQCIWSSADKQLAFAGFEAGDLSRTLSNGTFSTVTNPTNQLYAIRDVDGADDKSRVYISGSTVSDTDVGVYYSTNPTATTPTWNTWGGIASVGSAAKDVFLACDATGTNAFVVFGADTLDPSDVTNSPWKTTNGGATSSVMSGLTRTYGGAECVHMAKANSNRMFIGTAGTATEPARVFYSSNGSNFTSVVLSGLNIGQKVFDIDSDETGLEVYAACTGGKMYKSIDGGASFSQILTGVTTESVRSVAVSRDGEMVAFGLQNGQYLRSFDGGNNFSLTTLHTDKILAMNVNGSDNLMYAGSSAGKTIKSEL